MNRSTTTRRAEPIPAELLAILTRPRCHRCGGLMVPENCMDLLDDTGLIDFNAKRCIQCGDVVDAVILLNRFGIPRQIPRQMVSRRHTPMTAVALATVAAAWGANSGQNQQSDVSREAVMKKSTGMMVALFTGSLALSMGLTLSSAVQAADTDMVSIPKGEFTMGSGEHADETPHKVVLDAYTIDKYEVSNKDYGAFIKATGHAAPAYWDDPRLNKSEQPVVGVNWFDAKAFCEWKGKRLPTEAEWERAAKGPSGDSHFPWGHKFDPKKANYGQHLGWTSPVTAYPEGASGFGAFNMAGNVFEWVADWYDPDYYTSSPALNPVGPEKGYNFANQGPVKALRGGSWLAPETSLHTSHRFWNQPENNSYGVGLGFRCAKGGPKVVASPAESGLREGRNHYIQALVKMGVEKHAEALEHIEQALKLDPNKREYQDVRSLIKKSMGKK